MSNEFTKSKISKTKKENPTNRKIDLYTIDGKFIKTYNNVHEASEELECHMSVLNMCIRNTKLTVRGYIAVDNEFSKEDLKIKLESLEDIKLNKPSIYKSFLTRRIKEIN